MIKCHKIAIVGAHSCGKTTLVYEIAAYLKRVDKSVAVVMESARYCPFDLGTIEAAHWMLFHTVKEEVSAMKGHEYVICDRSTGDTIAYALVNKHTLDKYIVDFAVDHLQSYSKIIHLIPSRPIINDGFRDLDEDYRQNVADEFVNIFGEGIRYDKSATTNIGALLGGLYKGDEV